VGCGQACGTGDAVALCVCDVRCVWLCFFSSGGRHTRFKCDCSADVCSSDLVCWMPRCVCVCVCVRLSVIGGLGVEIGRASCRERVEISVVAVSLKTNTQ